MFSEELDVELIGQLQREVRDDPSLLYNALRWIPPAAYGVTPGPSISDWSVHRHVFHLMYNQRYKGIPRIHRVLQPSLVLEPYREDADWREDLPLAQIAAWFRQDRTQLIDWLAGVDESCWVQTYRDPRHGPTSFLWYVQKLHQHTLEHVNILLKVALFGLK